MGCIPTKLCTRSKKGDILRWMSEKPMTSGELKVLREQFWDTQPYYGGDKVIWDALKAAFGGDPTMRGVILTSAGIIIGAEDLSVLYDEKGVKYELPKYILSDPANLIMDKSAEVAQVDLSAHG